MRNTISALAALTVLSLAACREDAPASDPRTDSVTSEEVRAARSDWPAGVSELVDSANVAYSAQDYDQASALYRRASERAPDVPAVWFGIYMAEHARGNVAAADSAIARAQQLAPGASLIHGTPADTAPVISPH